MPGVTVSTTTDSPEQVKEALAHYGYGQESVEIIQTKAEDPPKETPKEEPPAPAKPEGSEDKSDAAPGAATENQEPQPGADEKDKPKPGDVSPAVQKRIDKAVAKQRDAERRAEEEKRQRETAERKLADLEAAKAAPAKPEPEPAGADAAKTGDDPEPALDAFENYEDWLKAHQKWTARQETAPLRAELEALKVKLEARDRDESAQKARQPLVDAWVEKVDKAKAAHPDYDEVTERTAEEGLVATPAMHQEIFESEEGAEIVYFLATHPEDCRRIAEMTAVPEKPTPDQVGKAIRVAAREIGMIEARIKSPSQPVEPAPSKAPETQKRKPSAAPPPLKTVGSGSVSGTKDPGTMSPAEYAEWRTAHPNG